jgi:hypothetical protein
MIELDSSDIADVKIIGELNGEKVKLLRTTGGFNIVVGKRHKSDKNIDTLAVGSHPAIAVHQVEKAFKGFQKDITKTENNEESANIENFTSKFSKSMQNDGFELFCIMKSDATDFIATKRNIEIAKITIGNTGMESKISGIANKEVQSAIISTIKEILG